MASPVRSTFATDSTPEESYTVQYDLDNPLESYSRTMHQHTKRQMETATRSSRRGPADQALSSMSNLSAESSVDSVDSLRQ